MSIITNQQTLSSILNKNFKLEIHSHNLLCISADFKIVSLRNSFNMSVKDVPEGIARLTISDNEGKPLCERLVYIHHNQKQ